MSQPNASVEPISFETHPSRYRHLKLSIDGPVATIRLDVQEDGLRPGYVLKLNSYDLGVDIELSDAVQRLRFEHPEVSAVVLTSGQDGVFSAGANIFMLGSSSHGFKVNFCKYTNETRLSIEDATAHSGQTYVAALNGIASGGGYELALACDKIFLVDDRRSAAALPEVPYLGVLPGTGGLTRVVDKRRVRRDRADIFCTLAEGVKGQRAKQWGIVDDVFGSSTFSDRVAEVVRGIAGEGHKDRRGVELPPLRPQVDESSVRYRHVTFTVHPEARTANLEVRGPEEVSEVPAGGDAAAAQWYLLHMFRELDDALLRLRFNHREIGLVTLTTRGDPGPMLELDARLMAAQGSNWFAREVALLGKRVLKRLDLTAKSFFALVDGDSCFFGTLFELALAADRVYALDAPGVEIALSEVSCGLYPMSNGLTRLQTRFLDDAGAVAAAVGRGAGNAPIPVAQAEEMGLVTMAIDDLDWDDETRVAIEERASLSPDSLTGLEASLRFAGPETLETKIFGRLSAWQNWIFQRPNAVGPKGALTLYGQPESPEFIWERT